MNFLSREQIKAAKGRRFAVVDLPGVGPVRIGSPSARQAQQLKALYKRFEAEEDVDAELSSVALQCIVDGDGERVLDDQDIERIREEWSSETLIVLSQEITKIVSPSAAKARPADVPSSDDATPESGAEGNGTAS